MSSSGISASSQGVAPLALVRERQESGRTDQGPILGANWVQCWKCQPNATTMWTKPGSGHTALKYTALQCHSIAAPMRARTRQIRFEILDNSLRRNHWDCGKRLMRPSSSPKAARDGFGCAEFLCRGREMVLRL